MTSTKTVSMLIDQKKIDLHHIFKYLLILIPMGVVGNLLFTFFKTDRTIWSAWHSFSHGYLMIAFILSLIPWFTNATRLWIWTRFLKNPVPYKNTFSIVLATEMGSAISPTAVGGGYVKLGMLIQKGFPPGSAASVMILGTLEDLSFFAITIPLALWYSGAHRLLIFHQIFITIQEKSGSLIWILGTLCGLIVCLLLVHHFHLKQKIKTSRFYRKIYGRIQTFFTEFITVYHTIGKKGKLIFLITFCLTAIQWICRYSVISALLACFHITVQPILFFLLQWIVFSFGTFIPTPGGAVGIEAAFLLVYSTFIPAPMIGLVTATWRFLTYYILLTLGSILFFSLNYQSMKKETH